MCFLSKGIIYIISAFILSKTFGNETEFSCNDDGGICRRTSQCPNIFKIVHLYTEEELKKPCAYTEDKDLICCPNIIPPNSCIIDPNRKFEQECKRYADKRANCTDLYPYISAGKNAVPKEFPFMARLGWFDQNTVTNVNWICGGTLISNKFVLTAAHCFLSDEDPKKIKYRVRLGALVFENTEDDANVQDFDVISICPYDAFKTKFDIAVIELNNTVKFNEYIFPACLPSPSCAPFPNLQTAGWGITETDGDQASHLQKALLKKFEFNTNCDNNASPSDDDMLDDTSDDTLKATSKETSDDTLKATSKETSKEMLNEKSNLTQICYGSKKTEENTCAGDSGGPLFWNHPNYKCIKLVFGIVAGSPTDQCVGVVVPYTKVSYFLEFIEDIVWLNKKCSDVKKLLKLANLRHNLT